MTSIDLQRAYHYSLYISKGIFFTLHLLCGAALIGFILGVIMSIVYYSNASRIINCLIRSFISMIRGTPLILQMSIIYFVLPGLLNIKITVIYSGILSMGLNSSAYVAEIIRAGIESIPKGQFEAAYALKIKRFYMWRDILLPQVFRNILPALISEIISLLKETAIISTIGGIDIMKRANDVAAEDFIYFEPMIIAGLYYYIFILLIEYCGRLCSRRLNRHYKK